MQTKQQLIEENRRLQSENTIYLLALNDLVDGKTVWFKNKKLGIEIGVCGVNRASGGQVIIKMNMLTQAFDYTFWEKEMRNYIPSHTDEFMLAYRNMFFEVQQWVHKQYKRQLYGEEIYNQMVAEGKL